MLALICSYNALVLGVRLSHARYSSDVNTLGDDGILPVQSNRTELSQFKIQSVEGSSVLLERETNLYRV